MSGSLLRVSDSFCLACEFRHIKNPFLPREGINSAMSLQDQHDIAGNDERELVQWSGRGGEKLCQRPQAPTDALYGDAGIQKPPGRLQCDEIREAVTGMTTGGLSLGGNQAGFSPVAELTGAQPRYPAYALA